PHLRVLDELYPFHDDYERLLQAGVTTLALVPSGRGINGQGAIIKPAGTSAEKMAIVPNAPLTVGFAANTPTQNTIRLAFESARGGGGPSARPSGTGEAAALDDFDADEDFAVQRRQPPGRPPFVRPPTTTGSLEARREPMVRAVNGDIPTFIRCDDPAAVLYALRLFQPYDRLKPVFILTPECYRVAEQLGQKKASVVLPADLTFEPNTRNRINAPALLAKAGAKVACRPPTDDVEGYQSLLFKMGELVKAGLDRDLALKAITLHPAEMLHVANRVGSLEVGRDGNLLLLDGDPLNTLTKVEKVVLEGKVVSR
ncbi:MAG: amidohydrolase family protein, partial [Abditibacteriales bacterium]|nr:amidohydrolase family protein [Abditibacteriales bacterium]MDW8368011.1 amidohydrolase family protein [Abditibacteriales bacterium]